MKIPERYAMTDDVLFELCVANKELRIERDEEGQLIIMSPAGSFSSNLNFRLNILFGNWVEANPTLGYGFDSSGGFTTGPINAFSRYRMDKEREMGSTHI